MNISDYRKTSVTLAQDLAKLELFADDLKMKNVKAVLHELNEHIRNDRFNLAVLGEFRRGKSSLINALLRTPVLPSDVVPTTACVNRITYDPKPRALVAFGDGTEKEIDISELTDYATKEGDSREGVREVTVWYPTVYCANNVDIYDTPGLNDSEDMTKATMDVLYRMDVAIFTLMANVNMSESEVSFVSEKLLTSNIGKVIFVVTHMGGYTPQQQEKILNSIRRKISEMVLGKAEKVLAEDPVRLEEFRKKLGDIGMYGVDSMLALEGRKNYDARMLEESGFSAFEQAVDELLTKERGRVMLEKQTGAILKSAADITNVIQARLAPLSQDETSYKETCRKANAEIAAIEARAEQECSRLDESRETVYALAAEEWKTLTDNVRNSIRQAVTDHPFTDADLKNKSMHATMEHLWDEQIAPMITSEMQIGSEQIQNRLNDAIGHECKDLAAFEDEVAEHCGNIQLLLQPKGSNIQANVKNILLNTFTWGSGSVAAGYKAAGAKGALVGGLSGAAINMGSAAILSQICVLAGMTVTLPVGLAVAAVSAVAGLFGGKKIVNVIFKKPAVIKQDIITAFCEQFDQSIEGMDARLKEYVKNTFDAIQEEIRANTTGSAKDLQKALQETREQYAVEKGQLKQKLQIYTSILETISNIANRTRDCRLAYGLDAQEEPAGQA